MRRRELLELQGAGPTRWRSPGKRAVSCPGGSGGTPSGRPTTNPASCSDWVASSPRPSRVIQRQSRPATNPNRGWRCSGRPRDGSRRRPASCAAPGRNPGAARTIPPPARLRRDHARLGDVAAAPAPAPRNSARSRSCWTPPTCARWRRPRPVRSCSRQETRDRRCRSSASPDGVARVDAPCETARVRVLIGLACRALGDPETSAMARGPHAARLSGLRGVCRDGLAAASLPFPHCLCAGGMPGWIASWVTRRSPRSTARTRHAAR